MKNEILLISTLDTKGTETEYLKDRIQQVGLNPVLLDLSMRGSFDGHADITPEDVVHAAGSTLNDIRECRERSIITRTVITGAQRIARKYYDDGRFRGVMGLGGSTGSLMATEVMRVIPFGVPKLMISSTAALPGLATRYIGTGDIALFHSVVEISGLTQILKNVLDRAVYALAGMLNADITRPQSRQKKAIAMTMLGPCEQCATAARTALEERGYQVIGFSAAGVGDRAMEEMMANGFFHGIIDLAPGGVGEHLFGFMRDAGPNRMEAAGRKGCPQIISTCSVNHITPSKSRYKPEYRERPKYDLDKYRTWLRMSEEELVAVADAFTEKLNCAKGPVKILVPMKGWSGVDVEGNPTYNPEADQVFVKRLRDGLNSSIPIIEIDANMENPAFARAIVREALAIF
ncbi:MAG: Tm-1-like ATP-binding domain-containing protein [Desulfobacteraceae bacterium]|nr:Tm-1-like ATP-binding domain-containing protein [Desulfobacteraceae bacterium]